MSHRSILALACFAIVMGGCDSDESLPGRDAGRDSRPVDGFPDVAAMDVAGDRVPDVAPDSVADTGFDSAPDAGVDVGIDSAPDAQPDAGVDAQPDAGADAQPDSGADAQPDGSADASSSDAGSDTAPDVATACGVTPRGDLCFSYCDGIVRFCTGANAQFQNAAACRAACDSPGSTWACGNPGDFTGNSLHCRISHMALAGVGSAAAECPNAGPNSPICR